MSILFYKSFFLDIVNSENVDSDNISTETSNCDPSSAEIDDHAGEQTGILESCDHGSTEISGCRSSSIEIDDHDNAENVDHGDTVINGCCSPRQGSTETDDNSGIESDIHENNITRNVGNHQKYTQPSTPLQKSKMPPKRSPLSELLVYPTPTQKVSKTKSCARVLTSAESIAMLEEKARKKREEQEEKERKKKERELKKATREEEKKRKAQERQAKQAEKQKKADQKKSNGQKRKNSSSDGSSKRQRLDRGEDESQDAGIQHHEISKDECAACFGLFEDDADSVEWIECTNKNCRVWAHAECLEMCDDAYVCIVCETLLV